MKVSIVVPAYNEEKRIARTLKTYGEYFDRLVADDQLVYELVVVANGCVDNTVSVVQGIQKLYPAIRVINLVQAGKGIAIKVGFEDALSRNNDLIGFVDADMATEPKYFYDLVKNIGNYDGIIASRYMEGAIVVPPRPAIKRWGSKLFFHSLMYILFGLRYKDTQCGAKLFKRGVIETIVPHMIVEQWAFDVELLYLCKKYGFSIKEFPTVWYDQTDSKLSILGSGFGMLGALFQLRWRHFRTKK